MPLVKNKASDSDQELSKQVDAAIKGGVAEVAAVTAALAKEPTDPVQKRISRAGLVQAAGQVVGNLNVAQYVEQPTLDAVMAEVKRRTRELAVDWLQFINE